MIKKIVITGATSLIGTALIDECIENNIEVLAICGKDSANIGRITNSPLVSILESDISEYSQISNISGTYDAFVHLAWKSTQGNIERNQIGAQIDNIRYSIDAVDLADRLGCSIFIGAGSQAEYGRTDEVLSEDTSIRPETAYGMAKFCAGGMTRLHCRQKGIKHIWTRILSAYGPKYQPRTVLNYTLLELLNGRSPDLTGGDQLWDFIYSSDVARAIILLIEKGHDGETYVIGSGQSLTLREYLMKARDILVDIEKHDLPLLNMGSIEYDENTVMHLECDISKLNAHTGFAPKVSFEDGIRKTVQWIKEEWI